MRLFSDNIVRRAADHSTHRLAAIIKSVGVTASFAALLCGVASEARCQTALSFVTSKGVQLYDLAYVSSTDCTPHLFPGTPTKLPGPMSVAVFSMTMNDPTLIGHSFSSVFNANEAAIAESLSDPTEASEGSDSDDPPGDFFTILCGNYPITVNDPGNPAAEVTVDGVKFSNGQDIGTIILDPPPITFSVYGLVRANTLVPEPGACAMLAGLGLSGAAFLRRKRAR